MPARQLQNLYNTYIVEFIIVERQCHATILMTSLFISVAA